MTARKIAVATTILGFSFMAPRLSAKGGEKTPTILQPTGPCEVVSCSPSAPAPRPGLMVLSTTDVVGTGLNPLNLSREFLAEDVSTAHEPSEELARMISCQQIVRPLPPTPRWEHAGAIPGVLPGHLPSGVPGATGRRTTRSAAVAGEVGLPRHRRLYGRGTVSPRSRHGTPLLHGGSDIVGANFDSHPGRSVAGRPTCRRKHVAGTRSPSASRPLGQRKRAESLHAPASRFRRARALRSQRQFRSGARRAGADAGEPAPARAKAAPARVDLRGFGGALH